MIAWEVRLVLLGILVMLAVGVVESSTASALPTAGPFWQVGGAQLPIGTKKAITGKLHPGTEASLIVHIGNIWLLSMCRKVEGKGFIFNGTQHGEGEQAGASTECNISESTSGYGGPYTPLNECKQKEPLEAKIKSSLWYHTTNVGHTRTGTEQILGPPLSGETYAIITLLGSGCGALAEAKLSIVGSGAAELRPQNTEVEVGQLVLPTEQQKHLWQPKNSPEETQVALTVEKTEADSRAEGEVELANKEKFGTIE